MSTFKTEGLVLAKRQLKAADRLYILYTKDYGKVEAQVRSAASSKSKLAGHLEPISLSQLMVAKGKHFETVAGAKLINHFSYDDWQLQSQAALACELVLKAIKNNLPQEEIFNLLKAYLESLAKPKSSKTKGDAFFLALRFIWQLLIHLGYKIELKESSWPASANLSPSAKDLLQFCLAEKSKLTKSRYSFKVIRELARFTQNYLSYFLEIELKSFYPALLSDKNF